MGSNIWWDREFDRKNRRIRDDIREAGRRVWPQICAKIKARLGDDADAPEIMEIAIAATSRYLDKHDLPQHSGSIEGLVLYAVRCRILVRLRKEKRHVPLEETSLISGSGSLKDWSLEIEREADLRKILTLFSPRGCTIILLRLDGVSWAEIASHLGIAPSTAQNSFWREVRQVRIKLGVTPKPQNQKREIEPSKG
jgi:DNA-directed RNA polymerase specialized sigma24 family protein